MILDRFRLDGAVAIVTGAGRGIGRAVALALAEAGADVVAASRTHAELDAVVDEIAARDRLGRGIVVDVRRRADIDRLISETVQGVGQVDILVNNAGI